VHHWRFAPIRPLRPRRSGFFFEDNHPRMIIDLLGWISFVLTCLGIYLQLRSSRPSSRKRVVTQKRRVKLWGMEYESRRRDEDIQS
jgi:hypothetical protein